MHCQRNFPLKLLETHKYIFKKETGICAAVDPWGGSYYLEKLTHDITHRAWQHIQEIEDLGGMAKAIETGIPKMRIEEAAARKQKLV